MKHLTSIRRRCVDFYFVPDDELLYVPSTSDDSRAFLRSILSFLDNTNTSGDKYGDDGHDGDRWQDDRRDDVVAVIRGGCTLSP